MRLSSSTTTANARPGSARARQRRGSGGRHPLWRIVAVLGLGLVGVGILAATFVAGAMAQRNGTVALLVIGLRARISPGYWLTLPFSKQRFPIVRIHMPFKGVQKIQEKRDVALRNRILNASDSDFVKAKWEADGQTLAVKMRLKGDWVDHLRGTKLSYRVHVQKGDVFLGMRNFSIQHPATRNYLYEWAFLEHLRSEGVIAPRYPFVQVVFNGDKLGIFAVEEHFSKELLESQQRREGPILKFDEDTLWRQRVHNTGRTGAYTDAFLLDSDDAIFDPNAFTADVATFGVNKLLSSPVLRDERDAAIGLVRGYTEGRLSAATAFDAALVGKFLAVVELWSAEHQLDWHNLRFYLNPVTGKLEPIGFDAEPPEEPAYLLLATSWGLRLLDDPEIAVAYVRELRRMSSPSYLDDLRGKVAARYEDLARGLFWEFGLLPRPWPVLEERQRRIRLELEPVKLASAFLSRDDAGDMVVMARNLTTLPLEIGGLRALDEGWVDASSSLTDAARDRVVVTKGIVYLPPTRASRESARSEHVAFSLPPSVRTQLSVDESAPVSVELRHRLAGDSDWRVAQAVAYPPARSERLLTVAPTIDEALQVHSFLARDPSTGGLKVIPGEWVVQGNLIVPDGAPLSIAGGTTLRFDVGAYLQATAPLQFIGAANQRITIEGTHDSWGGILVVRAGADSTWRFVDIGMTTGPQLLGLGLSGGVNLYESPIAIHDSCFLGSSAEDMVNVIRTRIELTRVELADAASDAIDGDFIEGRIQDCSFHDIAGDAIDVSGSTLHVEHTIGLRIQDKLISAGEASTVVAHDIEGEQVGIGIASKDRSRVIAHNVRILGARTAALAAYTKKPEFGPATLEVVGLTTARCGVETFVDLASWIEIDGRHIEGKESVDIKTLYAEHVLGN